MMRCKGIRLAHKGSVLENKKFLSEYNITAFSVLQLLTPALALVLEKS